jgi:hypothetical protein
MRCFYMASGWLALDALLVYGQRMACAGCGSCIWPVLDALLVYSQRMACAGCAACIWHAHGLRWMRCLYMACAGLALDALLVHGLCWIRCLYMACGSRSIASVALLVYAMDEMHSLCMICARPSIQWLICGKASIFHRRDASLVEMRKSVDMPNSFNHPLRRGCKR